MPIDSKIVRRIVREAAGANRAAPVEVIAGSQPPAIVGDGWHYRTPAGDYVRFPGAYRRKFGRPVYVHSTRRVVVGLDWLLSAVA